MNRIQMDVLGLSTSPSTGGAYALILNEIEGNRRLPIIIGTFEAQAIALELEHIKPPRPMTHDLLKNFVENFGSTIDHIIINKLTEGTFFSRIAYQKNGDLQEQDARPSDAIALAVRFDAPIYVASEVLDEAGIKSESSSEEQLSGKPGEVEKGIKEDMSKLDILEEELKTAIETENYEKAAKLRDEISKLKG